MDSKTLRKKRKDFREKNNHKHLPEVPLIASKESTAMFNVAWMQQLIPYLAWKPHPLWKRLYNIQKCVRTVDIDEVWDSSHLTLFEMMWNWSLGDYFKKESIQYSYDFLVNELWFDPKKLAITVFEWDKDASKDSESVKYRQELWIPLDKISFMWAENNRRSPGPVWPCGTDTEIFYRTWEWYPSSEDNVKRDESERVEIRNNVFMEYYRDENWKLTKLKNQNVDTGMGFERMCMVLQNKNTIFETDIFQPIIDILQKHIGLKYDSNQKRFRIIADHLKTSILLLNDWVIQSNIWSGYVLRMIIRRMYYNLILLKDISDKDFQKIISEIVEFLSTEYSIKQKEIQNSLLEEIAIFKKTISKGIKELESMLSKNTDKLLSWKDVFFLYDTCGFPIELTKEICLERWIKVDEEWFQKELENQKERSRKSSKFNSNVDRSKYLEWIPQTEFIWYNLDWEKQSKLLKDFELDWQRVLIFDKTPFYAESGGQKWDSWEIELDDWEIVKIRDVQKYEWVFLHLVG